MPPRSSSPICERSLDLTLIGIGRRDIPQCSPKHFLMEVFYRTFSGGRRHSGTPRLDTNFNPLSLREFGREWANERPWAVHAELRGGSGSTPSTRNTAS